MKKVISLVCATTLLFGYSSTGCITKTPMEEMIEHLESKYPNDDFTWNYNLLRSETSHSEDFAIVARSANFPTAEIVAERQKQGTTLVYFDNYMAHYYKKTTELYVQSLLEPIFGECKVRYTVSKASWIGNGIPFDITPDEFLQRIEKGVIEVFLPPLENNPPDIPEDQIAAFEQIISEHQWTQLAFGVLSFKEKEQFDSYDISSDCDRNAIAINHRIKSRTK